MIIITGAAGFIGARLVERFQTSELVSVDELSYFGSRTEHNGLNFGTQLAPDDLTKKWPTLKPRAVFHIGACSSTTEMREDYLNRVNLEYSQTLWSLCTQDQIPLFYASSAATYGDGESGFSDNVLELNKLKPLNPYGWSKHRFDLWVQTQVKSGKAPPRWAGFKFFNVYGFGERHKGSQASMVLHSFDQIQKTGKVKLFKSHRPGILDGEQKRDFIFVNDVIQTLASFQENKHKSGLYNLGTGLARSFNDLVLATFKALKTSPNIEYIETPTNLREQYQYYTQATTERLRDSGYKEPFTSLESGVEKYVQKLLNFKA